MNLKLFCASNNLTWHTPKVTPVTAISVKNKYKVYLNGLEMSQLNLQKLGLLSFFKILKADLHFVKLNVFSNQIEWARLWLICTHCENIYRTYNREMQCAADALETSFISASQSFF